MYKFSYTTVLICINIFISRGASVSTVILYNGKGQCLAQSSGLGTNHWVIITLNSIYTYIIILFPT